MFTLFKPKKIVFKGRAGLIFNIKKNESYFVDSEMLNGKYDIIIYKNSILKLPNKQEINDSAKKEVLDLLIKELEKQNIKYEIGE